MHSVPMLFVEDVPATSRWYQDVLALESGHGGDEFEMLMSDGKKLLQLHRIDDDHHNHQVELARPHGHGVVVVIYVPSAADSLSRAQQAGAHIRTELVFNEQANMYEFSMTDPNGYALMICEATWANND